MPRSKWRNDCPDGLMPYSSALFLSKSPYGLSANLLIASQGGFDTSPLNRPVRRPGRYVFRRMNAHMPFLPATASSAIRRASPSTAGLSAISTLAGNLTPTVDAAPFRNSFTTRSVNCPASLLTLAALASSYAQSTMQSNRPRVFALKKDVWESDGFTVQGHDYFPAFV